MDDGSLQCKQVETTTTETINQANTRPISRLPLLINRSTKPRFCALLLPLFLLSSPHAAIVSTLSIRLLPSARWLAANSGWPSHTTTNSSLAALPLLHSLSPHTSLTTPFVCSRLSSSALILPHRPPLRLRALAACPRDTMDDLPMDVDKVDHVMLHGDDNDNDDAFYSSDMSLDSTQRDPSIFSSATLSRPRPPPKRTAPHPARRTARNRLHGTCSSATRPFASATMDPTRTKTAANYTLKSLECAAPCTRKRPGCCTATTPST